MSKKHIYALRAFDKYGDYVAHKMGVEGREKVNEWVRWFKRTYPQTQYIRIFNLTTSQTRYVGKRD